MQYFLLVVLKRNQYYLPINMNAAINVVLLVFDIYIDCKINGHSKTKHGYKDEIDEMFQWIFDRFKMLDRFCVCLFSVYSAVVCLNDLNPIQITPFVWLLLMLLLLSMMTMLIAERTKKNILLHTKFRTFFLPLNKYVLKYRYLLVLVSV